MAKAQHLISLIASNFKRLTAVRIHLDVDKLSGVIRLTGDNKAGKSSAMDAITAAILGKKYIPDEPVHRGAEKAEVVFQTEELKVTRTFTPTGGGTLKVEDMAGRMFTSPQALLDELCFKTGFDPLSFARLDEKKQTEMLLSICPVGLDLEANAADYKVAYDERRDLNRDLKRERAQLDGWTPPDVEIPETEIKVSDLVTESDALKQKGIDRTTLQCEVTDGARSVEQFKEDIRKKQALLVDMIGNLEVKQAELAETPDPAEAIEFLRVRIDNAEETNTLFRNWEARRAMQVKIDGLAKKSIQVGAQLERLTQARVDALKAVKFPIEGLSLSAGGMVTYNDLPFSQASTAEEIEVGVALAVAANPTLRLVFVPDGSLLDKKSMALLNEMAEKHDLQVLIERVDDKSPAAIEIVDGRTEEVAADGN